MHTIATVIPIIYFHIGVKERNRKRKPNGSVFTCFVVEYSLIKSLNVVKVVLTDLNRFVVVIKLEFLLNAPLYSIILPLSLPKKSNILIINVVSSSH